MKCFRTLFIAGLLLAGGAVCLLRAEEPRVLVYTRNHVTNGKGYVHDNIAASVAMISDPATIATV